MIRVTCPQCQWKFAVGDEMVGQKERCLQCGQQIRIVGDSANGNGDGSMGQPIYDDMVVGVQGLIHQTEAVILSRIHEDAFVEFVGAVARTVRDYFLSLQPQSGENLTLVWAAQPGGRVRYWLDFDPGKLPDQVVNSLRAHLESLPPPPVQNGPISHVSQFRIWGGAGHDDFGILPREWQQVIHESRRSLEVPDEVLKYVWGE